MSLTNPCACCPHRQENYGYTTRALALEECERLRAENAALRDAMTWQPIESAPKDKPLLLLLKTGGIKWGFWDKERECWDTNTMFDLTSHITHWALIPKMPKE